MATRKRSRGNPEVLQHVVVFLRSLTGKTQAQLGKAARVDQSHVSRYEAGKQAPEEDVLRRMAAVAGVEWPVVVQLCRVVEAILATSRRRRPGQAGSELPLSEGAVLDLAQLAIAQFLVQGEVSDLPGPAPEEEVREAEQIWAALAPFPPAERRELLGLAPRASRSWAVAGRLREASLAAAANPANPENPTNTAEDAAELAALARWVAGRAETAGLPQSSERLDKSGP